MLHDGPADACAQTRHRQRQQHICPAGELHSTDYASRTHQDAKYHLKFCGWASSNCDPQLTDADDDRLRMPEKFEHLRQVGGRCVLAGCPTTNPAKSLLTQQLVIRTALDVSACLDEPGQRRNDSCRALVIISPLLHVTEVHLHIILKHDFAVRPL